MKAVNYHPGGFISSAPRQNKSDEMDSATGLFTAWDVAGVQTQQRALTGTEIAQLAAADTANTGLNNGVTLRSRAAAALTTNATFLAIASPTTAQVATQAKALTRQVDGIIRLLLNQLDSIADS